MRDKIRCGQVCIGVAVTCTDPSITEALCKGLALDYVWIEMEHTALSLETVERHIIAAEASNTPAIVRVRCNDPIAIRQVLDLGAAGVIIPMVRNAEEVRRAVAASRYPPEGIRGFGPRRPFVSIQDGPTFCKNANANVITIAQIEHIDAVRDIDNILAVNGLTGIIVGPADLACTMGYPGEPKHPDVERAVDLVIAKSLRSPVWTGMGSIDPDELIAWVKKGVQWLGTGSDITCLLRGGGQLLGKVRDYLRVSAESFRKGHG